MFCAVISASQELQRRGVRQRRCRQERQAAKRGANKIAEERMRPVGPRQQLRMELRAEHQGWSRSSQISTSEPSGETPLATSPACASSVR